jgi:adenylosuccinate lyase
VIREHAVAAALALREGGEEHNDLFDRLAADSRLPLDRDQLDALVADPSSFAGAAPVQVARFVASVAEVTGRYPDAARYRPGAIL